MWVHFLNSVGCRFNNQRPGLFLGGVRHQRTPPGGGRSGHRGTLTVRPRRRGPQRTATSLPAPDRFIRQITVFVRNDDGSWRRDDERHGRGSWQAKASR
jgi:hypothetical protein